MLNIHFLRSTACLLLLAAASHAAACSGNARARPLSVIAEHSNALLHQRDFKALDAMGAEFQRTGAAATDGQPKLIGFYQGLTMFDYSCAGRAPATEWALQDRLLHEWQNTSRDTIMPTVALAKLEELLAWQARGNETRFKVTQEQWQGYYQHIANARGLLDSISPDRRNDPEWYNTMLEAITDVGDRYQEYDRTYAEAVQKFPLYYVLYFNKGRYYSGTWANGSHVKFSAFVEESVKSTEPVLGQTMYERLHWSNSSEDMFETGKTDWKRMKLGFERLLSDYPDPWNRNSYAMFACRAGDAKTLAKQLKIIGDDAVLLVWGSMQYYNYCTALAQGKAV